MTTSGIIHWSNHELACTVKHCVLLSDASVLITLHNRSVSRTCFGQRYFVAACNVITLGKLIVVTAWFGNGMAWSGYCRTCFSILRGCY